VYGQTSVKYRNSRPIA